MSIEGKAEVTGHEQKDNHIIIRGYYQGPSESHEWWIKLDKKSGRIVDYSPK